MLVLYEGLFYKPKISIEAASAEVGYTLLSAVKRWRPQVSAQADAQTSSQATGSDTLPLFLIFMLFLTVSVQFLTVVLIERVFYAKFFTCVDMSVKQLKEKVRNL